jgi:RNase adapter protein RapZ
VKSNPEGLSKVALVVDIRGGRFFDDFEKSTESLSELGISHKIVYLDASEKALIKRFKETRRSHPLSPSGSIMEGIKIEKKKLARMNNKADIIIDTSSLSLSQLKIAIINHFGGHQGYDGIGITVMSFGFKAGIPLDTDMVFDVRMLPNPHYIEELRPQTGNDLPVQEYVMKFEESVSYLNKIKHMSEFLIPLCTKEGRSQFVIAIGCTGGQHRSVTFANKLGTHLNDLGHRVSVVHREL